MLNEWSFSDYRITDGVACEGIVIVAMDLQRKLNANMYLMSSQRMRVFIVIVVTLLVSACATTGGNNSLSDKQGQSRVARKNCTANTGKSTEQGNLSNRSQTGCLPLGVIEIYESAQIDSDIRDEFNQAVALLNQEKYSEAIKVLKAVSGKTSKFSAPFINLGIAYERTGDMEKAEENFKKALEISQQHPVAHNELALVYRKTGRYSEARELYESLLAVYPEFLPIRKNLGVLCDIYMQDLDCALKQYEEYLKGKPDDEKVKIWVADVKSRM
jgi:tetratricopeptide (TPR) repeat protein